MKKNYFLHQSVMVRQLSVSDAMKSIKNTHDKLKILIENGKFYETFHKNISSFHGNLKNQSSKILRIWMHQCECVVAQRLRRSQQMFCLYSKLWEEQALKEFLKRMKHQVTRHGKEIMCSAVGVSAFNWDKNRIPGEEILKHKKELEYIQTLREKTIQCQECINSSKEKTICHCPDKKKIMFEEWELFIEKDDLLIWRKKHDNGCYEYKVYGSYNDVTAEDFVNVQIDIKYRKTWDTTALVLELIEKDPTPKSNSDLVYWEMQWPRLFANRDYVFNRRFLVDQNSQTVIIASRCIEHPDIPSKPDKFRVKDYWSYMVVKPYTDYNKLGIEFGLTYFENSGVNVPSTVTSWVAMKAMPEYLTKLREATKKYNDFCRSNGHCIAKIINNDHHTKNINSVHQNVDPKTKDITKEPPSKKNSPKTTQISNQNVESDKSPTAEIPSSSPIIQNEYNSYWKYLHPTYYFS